MEAVLPLYYWPPIGWLQAATQLKKFAVGYPLRIPRSSFYYRCYLPSYGWLSIPLQRDSRKTPWQATWPPDAPWKAYHFKVLQTLYGKAPFFLEWKPLLEEIYLAPTYQTLAEISWRIIQEMALWHSWKVTLRVDLPPESPPIPPEPSVSSLDSLLRAGITLRGL